MKILHIIDSLGTGGKERRLLEFAKSVRAVPDIDTRLAVLSEKIHYTYAADMGVPIIQLPRRSRMDGSLFTKLYRLCRKVKPDIVHSWESMCSMYAAPVAKLMGITFINAMITNASPVGIGSRKWMRSKLTFPLSDLILANSHAGLAAYHAPPRKSRCVYNGFDFNRLQSLKKAADVRGTLGIRTPHVVGMVASVDARKDHDNFIRAAERVCRHRGDVTFLALGEGPLLERSRRMVPSDLADRILLPGRCADVESHVQIFSIGLLLTRPDRHGEGISNAVLEYMALAKPVIATAGGGTGEIVVDRQTGFLVDSNSDARLEHRIHFLLDHPAEAEKMGRAGRQRVHAHFSIEQMTDALVGIYRSCLQAKSFPFEKQALQQSSGRASSAGSDF